MQQTLFKLEPIKADIVYTQQNVVADMLQWLKPKGLILDPCMGDGAFYNMFEGEKDWCELRSGKDFFDYDKKVDWIIGNPPYSIFEDWLIHSFELADDIAYILPTNKVFQRKIIMDMINAYGGIKGMRVYGSGQNIGFPFGFSTGAFHFSRNYGGKCDLSLITKVA